MGRPVKIEYPGALYHVSSRGNERKDIFRFEKKLELDQGLKNKLREVLSKVKTCHRGEKWPYVFVGVGFIPTRPAAAITIPCKSPL
jgi:hypothetical protein